MNMGDLPRWYALANLSPFFGACSDESSAQGLGWKLHFIFSGGKQSKNTKKRQQVLKVKTTWF
jgi:hypothetical protein